MACVGWMLPVAAIVAAAPASAATPRELLVTAAFQTTDKRAALALVNQALAAADALTAANPKDREGPLQHAFAIGYRAKLTRNPGDAKLSRRLFEALVAGNPRDAEYQMAIGGWHLDAIADGILASTVLGAKRDAGLNGISRAVALGGDRAFFKTFAAMMRIRLDPKDVAAARALAERGAQAPAPPMLDRIARRDAEAILIPLRAGDGRAADRLARKLLPFGRIGG